VIAAARTPVAAVEIERLGTQSGVPSVLVQRFEQGGLLGKTTCGLNIDLDDTRVGRHGQGGEARVGRRAVALHDHRCVDRSGGVLDHLDDRQVFLEFGGRREEHVQGVAALLRNQRRTRYEGGGVDVDHRAAQCVGDVVWQRFGTHRRIGLIKDRCGPPRQ